ncbi:probable inactive receptor-like protein kinase At3g56050 isoform X2 [Cryptomeria japonica]|uniref:probable inactive receptor-like protein kinase At3g56050 isoform X2 n=1 Tax=Cryptomeria japonica TaxID=3369 RepID=UPI0027DA6E3D|nr:probable inactive receptor-like protein kinase At3g56050 isoform X2 [Cryptomeria japonica]
MECIWRSCFRFQLCQVFYMVLLLHLAVQKCWSLNFEGLALLAFRGRVDRDPYTALSDWNPYDEDPCKWYGVHCVDGKVVSLELAELSLQGILAPELGQLIHLQKLILFRNNFYGTIPKELGELENLEELDLGHNCLFGEIPSDIGNISTLRSLLLSNNELEGSIPPELGNLNLLTELHLERNQLSGVIPGFDQRIRKLGKSLCDLKHLKKVDFSFNYIGGEVPACLDHLSCSSFKWNCFYNQTSEQRLQQECGNRGLHSHQREWRLTIERTGVLTASENKHTPIRKAPEFTSGSGNGPAVEAPSFSLFPSPSPSPSSSLVSPSLTPFPSPSEPLVAPSQSPSMSPKLAPSLPSPPSTLSGSSPSSSSRKSMTYVYHIGIPVVASLLLTSFIILCIFRNRSVATIRPWKTGISGQLQKAFVTGVPKLNRQDLEAACEEFSNVIGSSPDGMIFKGTLSNGVEIAVTSTTISSAKDWSPRSEFYFRQKIEILSKINHKNFVNLVGYCEEEEPFIRMMVFEYAPNGTLFEHLHNKEAEHLDWAARMRIIMGVAYCLQYMHHDLDPPVTHPSLHSNAIYLTDDYASKLSDLDLWKEAALKGDQMKLSSESEGLNSYDDIELSDRHSLDSDSNVFCFGVLLLEIISGKLPYTQDQGLLVNWAMEYLQNKDTMNDLVDPSLTSFQNNELQLICEIAQSCIHPDPQQRPTMKEIVSKLRDVLSISPNAASPKLSPLWWAELEILSQDGS